MSKATILTIVAIALLAVSTAYSDTGVITGTAVEYKQGDTVLDGYLSYNKKNIGKSPAVIIVHDWMGAGEFTKDQAQRIAELGYVAFAADIYGKGVRPKNADEAGKTAGMYKGNRELMRKRIAAALDYVRTLDYVDKGRIAVMGYCFGGMVSLELARSGADLAGAVSIHGGLDTPEPKTSKIKAKVLALHGADDPYVTKEDVEAFQNEMRSAGADWYMTSYGSAVHAFTNPKAGTDNSKGAAYNEKADKRSWIALKEFLKEIFSK
ncbi:MAG: dienelactone hydrolase family protein [Candidatus Magnetominusculus sp. LBB02]|nr:dienelactone hydrolase family protein [Candidatus Magnetominusculus sp. LBB02]